MADRWSEAGDARRRVVSWARVISVLALTALFVANLIALANTKPHNGGGDCGGKGCMVDTWHGLLVLTAVVLAVLLLGVATWPLLVRLHRRQWGTE